VEQLSNTELRNFFSGIVANPSGVDAAHIPQLKVLVDLYPQSGIIRSLLARASQTYDQGGFQQRLKSAAVYAPDRSVLYNLINYPEKLVKPGKYIEEEPLAFIDDEDLAFDYTNNETYNYHAESPPTEQPADEYTEEVVYEEEPVNFFHEPEEAFTHQDEYTEPYQPVPEQDNFLPNEEQPGFYSYTGPEYVEEVETAQKTPYEYNSIEAEEEITELPFAASYTYAEPEEEQKPISNYNYAAAEDEFEEEAVPYVYEEAVAAPYVYEEEEEENPDARIETVSSFDHGSDPYQAPLPPVPPPFYNPVNYHREMVSAAADASSEIDDEVYDEIIGIEDISLATPGLYVNTPAPPDEHFEGVLNPPYQVSEVKPADNYDTNYHQEIPREEAKPYAFSAGSFKDKMEWSDDEEPTEDDSVEFEMVAGEAPKPMFRKISISEPANEQKNLNGEKSTVSKYDDDKMPYSFLWWLEKTRQEHSDTYQPYVAFKPITREVPRPASDALQMQYVENIFHLTSVEQLDIHTRDKRKESEIIDRFIQQDPQMKPPNTEKLDNENKAKKSAEDREELVTETLARIYQDQMLYNKAIATYQKLMLKFPEKSSYFVAQIKLLEKKIN
jgi:hypothetical protein